MDTVEARRRLARLQSVRERYDRSGKPLSVRQAAAELTLPKTTLHDLVGSWHRRPRRLGRATVRQLDKLIAAEVPEQEICRRLAIGKGTVNRRKAFLREKRGELARCNPWRCPGCGGQIELVRCIACGLERPDSGAGS